MTKIPQLVCSALIRRSHEVLLYAKCTSACVRACVRACVCPEDVAAALLLACKKIFADSQHERRKPPLSLSEEALKLRLFSPPPPLLLVLHSSLEAERDFPLHTRGFHIIRTQKRPNCQVVVTVLPLLCIPHHFAKTKQVEGPGPGQVQQHRTGKKNCS